jgi:prepilin-type processing-associated H-X9-DG protein
MNCGEILTTPPGGGSASLTSPGTIPQTSRLAVAAFVMGLLCLTCVLWPLLALPAILCAIFALVKINVSKGQLKGIGLAIAGLVVPVVLTFILPLFMAIMIPALLKAKETAKCVICANNLKTLSVAAIVYASDNDDMFPVPEKWCDLLIRKGDVSPNCFRCPSALGIDFSYAINENLYTSNLQTSAAQMVMLFEANLGRNGTGGPEDVVCRHHRGARMGCNIAFADGHIEFVTEERIAGLKWTAE